MNLIFHAAAVLAQALESLFLCAAEAVPGWRRTWPFGPGYEEGWLSTLAKFLLIGLILGGVALLLRWLFGPGGPMRDKEFDNPPNDEDDAEGKHHK